MFNSDITHVNAISQNVSIEFPICSLAKRVEMRTSAHHHIPQREISTLLEILPHLFAMKCNENEPT